MPKSKEKTNEFIEAATEYKKLLMETDWNNENFDKLAMKELSIKITTVKRLVDSILEEI